MPSPPPIVFQIDRQQRRPRPGAAPLRLVKTVWHDSLIPGTSLELLNKVGRVLDREVIHPEHAFPLAVGFWVPPASLRGALRLRVTAPGGEPTLHAVRLRGRGPGALPLTPFDDLHGYLQQRERAAAVWPGVAQLDVPRYLRRYAIVYEKPADHWGEGLYLGSGVVGAVATGQRDGVFALGLDHTRIWLADAQGRPTGRGYAADLTLRYKPGGDAFRQVLDIGEGRLGTQHGTLNITSWIDRETSLVHVDLRSSRAKTVEVRLGRRALPLWGEGVPAVVHGSWQRAFSPEMLAQQRERLGSGEQPALALRRQGEAGVLTYRAPNLSVVTTLASQHPATLDEQRGELCLTLRLAANRPQRLAVAVAVCDAKSERRHARRDARRLQRALVKADPLAGHRRAWRRFWNRSFLRLADPLQENLYYQGLYHLGCTFAGNDAGGFFGMTQPIDHRTWRDAHVTDAQTQMLQWGTLTSNHLATAAPLLQSYAAAWPEHAEHTAAPGAKVPHMFFPLEGGGHGSLAPPPRLPYPFGSTAWHALDFWWDYLYAQDERFLRQIAYPILRSATEAIVTTMTWRDGRYHCLASNSPEQADAHEDNVYDRVCVQALLEATIRAAARLKVDEAERRRWRRVLARLFPLAQDEQTLWECAGNAHPYRCHPVVLMGLYPLALWPPGSREHALADRTLDVVTNVFGFHHEDRHHTIVGHAGGVEPNGHATAFLLGAAARLRRPADVDRLFRALVVGRQLKRNGLRAICDPRHTTELERMAIIEASSGQSAALTERVLQSWAERIDVFPCAVRGKAERFAGLRAAGGFVVSGAWTGERVRFVAVRSLVGGTLHLSAPWEENAPLWVEAEKGGEAKPARMPLRMRAGETIVLSCRKSDLRRHRWTEPEAAPAAPVAIPVAATDPHTPEVLYYPEDLPHGQAAEAGHLFLGSPAALPPASPAVWDEARALNAVASDDARLRQTAARVLGRHATPRSRRALRRLAVETSPLVAATAAVSLVRHRTHAADQAIRRLLPRLAPYVRREAEKAMNRRKRSVG